MKILIVGSGAREHALAWKISQSPNARHIYAAPGNAGTAEIASNLNINPTDIQSLGSAAKEIGIDLTIVGPELSLAAGIVDHFLQMNLPIFGPTKSATQIESSKVVAKNLMQKYSIPCANSRTFSNYTHAKEYVETQQSPIVIKADGLAAGKGVIIANSKAEAFKALHGIMEAKIFGHAGRSVVVEEYLTGKEVSLLALTDGETITPMIPACDYKRAFDNDHGANTGGMGSYSPPGFFDNKLTKQVMETIIEPTVKAMAKEGMPYKGVLYAGLMITDDGPKALEFNARFGDPETQVIIPRLKTDLLDIFLAITDNRLDEMNIEWDDNACVGVVMTSAGYPENYKTGFPINGLNKLDKDIMIFHAGTKQGTGSQVLTNGGRVLTIVATNKTIAEARSKVYKNLPIIHFNGCHYRKDIAAREVN